MEGSEARAAGQLHHTSIVPVYAMGEDRGVWFYAMELVEGETLAGVVTAMRDRRAGDAPSEGESRLGLSSANGAGWARLAEAFAGVAEGLEAAHREGIVHRDVKPTNLLLSVDGMLKLVDFGLARLTGEGGTMTLTGQLLGTPHYMSPEQAMARRVPVDHRTDVYSLGATLYEVLTLRTPFQGDTLHEICSQILAREPVPARMANPRVPRDLETIVSKAMEKDRERRYASAGEMARDLRRFAEGAPIRARRIGPVARTWRRGKRNKVRAALVTAVLVLATVGSLLAWRASVEGARRAELEYAALCARAEEAIARTAQPFNASDHAPATHAGWATHGTDLAGSAGRATHGADSARELLGRAVDLLPERHEAYFLRALAAGRRVDERLADLDAARERGLPEGT